MKAENFARLVLSNCLTKKGTILSSDFDMLFHLIFLSKNKKRTFKWCRNGHRCSAKDTHYRDIKVLTKLGVDYGYFNDAPKCGQEGNYLIITEKGYRRIKPFIISMKECYNNKKRDIFSEENLLNSLKIVAKMI